MLDRIISRHPDILRRAEILERDLILIRLLQPLATLNLVDEALPQREHRSSSVFPPPQISDHWLRHVSRVLSRGLSMAPSPVGVLDDRLCPGSDQKT